MNSFRSPNDSESLVGDTQPRRIHIAGNLAGAGKTTLARRLGARLGIPVYDLDAIAYEGAYGGRPGMKRSLDQRAHDVSAFLAHPAWITEGCFLWWTDRLLEKAQLIIWLDIHWSLAWWRVSKREARRWVAGEKTHGGLLNHLRFLRRQRADYLTATPRVPRAPDDDSANSRAGTLAELTRFADKTIRCARTRDVEAITKSLWHSEPGAGSPYTADDGESRQ